MVSLRNRWGEDVRFTLPMIMNLAHSPLMKVKSLVSSEKAFLNAPVDSFFLAIANLPLTVASLPKSAETLRDVLNRCSEQNLSRAEFTKQLKDSCQAPVATSVITTPPPTPGPTDRDREAENRAYQRNRSRSPRRDRSRSRDRHRGQDRHSSRQNDRNQTSRNNKRDDRPQGPKSIQQWVPLANARFQLFDPCCLHDASANHLNKDCTVQQRFRSNIDHNNNYLVDAGKPRIDLGADKTFVGVKNTTILQEASLQS